MKNTKKKSGAKKPNSIVEAWKLGYKDGLKEAIKVVAGLLYERHVSDGDFLK